MDLSVFAYRFIFSQKDSHAQISTILPEMPIAFQPEEFDRISDR